jgi:hypothetical protein
MLCLSITGFEVNPDQVTELLGLEPSSTIREGEAHKSGRISKFNGWWLELHEAPLLDGGEHANAIDALIGQLKGREPRFVELARTIKPESITIYGGFYVSDEQQGVWLDAGQMAVLATCGIGWGLDLFEATMLS